jgi:ABC-2 type transport system ATP-binding protein
MKNIISIKNLSKTYASGHQALKSVNLDIKEGEILALLGSNGAGKTTLISIICGLVSPSEGTVRVDGFDIITDYRKTRELIGLVPQELTLPTFETIWNTVSFSRGLFAKKANKALVTQMLTDLNLLDKKNIEIRMLSGGMKRRVLIAKALIHEPRILFLDEPTAGVDVKLRKDMWNIVRHLRESGVTIILTTHYIEEAEEIADRVGIISGGELLLVDKKKALMQKLGKKQLIVELREKISIIPASLASYNLELAKNGSELIYTYNTKGRRTGITLLMKEINKAGLELKDLRTAQSSLEDIFISLVSDKS